MTDRDEAIKRLEKYSRYCRQYSGLCSNAQLWSVLCAFIFFLFFNYKSGLPLCFLYLTLNVHHYIIGLRRYEKVLDDCRTYVEKGWYHLVKQGDANDDIELSFHIKTTLWLIIMVFVTSASLRLI